MKEGIKPTLFIVEGPDGSGKSTLCNMLLARINACYMHMSGDKSLYHGMMAYHSEALISARITMDAGVSVIMDRHWPSEYCYGLTTRPSMQGLYDFSKMIERCHELNPIYIMCVRKGSSSRDQFQQLNHAHPFTEQDFVAIHAEYLSLLRMMREDSNQTFAARCIHYDRDIHDNHGALSLFISKMLKEHCL